MALRLVLAVSFLSLQHAASQNCTADQLRFQTVFESGFSRLSGEAGSIEPLYNMVNRYLDVVQPNPFPKDIILGLAKDRSVEPLKVVRYEAGYLVSFIIGVLFFILMPLVGLFFCCCRCCNKCGGQLKERTEKTDCQRNTLALFLLVTTLIILAGVACAFTANQKVTDAMNSSESGINTLIANVISYADNIVKAVPKIAEQFSVPKERTLAELDRINRTLGLTIKDALAPTIIPVLVMLRERIQEFNDIVAQLVTINSTQASLQETQRQLVKNLTDLRDEIITILDTSSCISCDTVRPAIENLKLNISYIEPTGFQNVLTVITSISQEKLRSSLQQGNRSFNEIPVRVNRETSQTIADIKVTIQKIEKDILSIADKVKITESLQRLTDSLNSSQVTATTSSVKEYDYYRWIVGIVLCCIILLIIACSMLGLGLGTVGIAARSDPYGANGCSQSGANFLMAGVGFSFIFSWLLILLVFVTFFVGGNVRTFACKPWETGEIYKALDTLAADLDFFNLSKTLNVEVNISELLRRCEKNESLFGLLPENQMAELNNFLNLSTYTGDLEKNVEQLNVNLDSIVLLDSAGNSSLLAFANSGISGLNYSELIQQVQQPILNTSLLELADALGNLSSIEDSEIKVALNHHAMKLRELQNLSVSKMQQDLAQLNTSFHYLASLAPTVENEIQNTIQFIKAAQNRVRSTTLMVVRNVSQCLITKELGYFGQYLDWVQKTIIDELLSCQPAVILLHNSRVILCEYITDPWNAFWFCLGWCTLFLIPSIIFAVKTAKHYRPMRNKANSPEFSEMTNFKFPRVQNTYGPPAPHLYADLAH
ncbi:prominin-2-like isoform X2 [Carcharodon carcharias]|uniref:prominin-2-like isoform X2 n=1 Tax=Carcharodon carcharias TaxID=13397 RepID=UPI001B7DF80D|nr:prominin-2-like isoform X2 [Carcharodon carcharias]